MSRLRGLRLLGRLEIRLFSLALEGAEGPGALGAQCCTKALPPPPRSVPQAQGLLEKISSAPTGHSVESIGEAEKKALRRLRPPVGRGEALVLESGFFSRSWATGAGASSAERKQPARARCVQGSLREMNLEVARRSKCEKQRCEWCPRGGLISGSGAPSPPCSARPLLCFLLRGSCSGANSSVISRTHFTSSDIFSNFSLQVLSSLW